LFGSLGLSTGAATHLETSTARKRSYVAMLAAVALDERSQVASVEALEKRWSVSIGEGAEEGWRDTALWLLAGHAQVSDLRCFYHHLKETGATPDQTQAVKSALRKLRVQSYELVSESSTVPRSVRL